MPIVICDHGLIEAKIVPADCLASPGMCRRGLYETVLISGGRPTDWEVHWGRFEASCEKLGMAGERTRFRESVERNAMTCSGRSRLRLMAYNQPVTLLGAEATRYLAAVWSVADVTPKNTFRCTLAKSRRASHDLLYNLKTLGLKHIDIELSSAKVAGFDDILFLNDRDELCEASYANLWIVRGETIITPPVDAPCLPGITRDQVLKLAKQMKLEARVEPLTVQDLAAATDVFLTSSIRGVQPVTEIDDLHFRPVFSLRLVEALNLTRV